MKQSTSRYLISSGIIALVGGLLHIAIIFGGPSWYAFFHAPEPLIQMVREGALYPTVFCLVVAVVLLSCASYAFSGAGIILHLPFLRLGLSLIATVFIFRGVAFIPLAILRPDILARICNCKGVDSFLVITSIICLATGVGYALGVSEVQSRHRTRAEFRRRRAPADAEV
jgi:hypothetical protein